MLFDCNLEKAAEAEEKRKKKEEEKRAREKAKKEAEKKRLEEYLVDKDQMQKIIELANQSATSSTFAIHIVLCNACCDMSFTYVIEICHVGVSS